METHLRLLYLGNHGVKHCFHVTSKKHSSPVDLFADGKLSDNTTDSNPYIHLDINENMLLNKETVNPRTNGL